MTTPKHVIDLYPTVCGKRSHVMMPLKEDRSHAHYFSAMVIIKQTHHPSSINPFIPFSIEKTMMMETIITSFPHVHREKLETILFPLIKKKKLDISRKGLQRMPQTTINNEL